MALAADLRRGAGERDDAAAALLCHADRVSGYLDFMRHEVQAVVDGLEHAGSSTVRAGESALHAIGL